MRIPFPKGLEGSENMPRTKQGLLNCFNNGQGRILPMPGITGLNTVTNGVARGSFTWNNSLYMVFSTQLIKITNLATGAYSVIGTISGASQIRTAVGFNHAAIIVKGGASYTLDKSDVLVDTSGNANFVPWNDVAHINGRFIYIPTNGDPAKFSDIGAAGTIQASSFFDAEELPDANNGCFNFKNTLYITGTDSIELFRDTGGDPNPWSRIPGSRILNGFISGLLEYNETFLFIGREKGQDVGIYAISQGRALKISNERIDLALIGYTEDELEEVVVSRFKWRGYDIATFTLSRDSFGYFGGQWFELCSLLDGLQKPWAGGFVAHHKLKYYTAFSNRIGVIDAVNTAYGERITRKINMVFEQEDGERFSAQAVELGISQGFNSADGSVALRFSRNGVQYMEPNFKNLGDVAEYDDKIIWNETGAGNFEGFMALEIYTAEDIFFGVSYIDVDLG